MNDEGDGTRGGDFDCRGAASRRHDDALRVFRQAMGLQTDKLFFSVLTKFLRLTYESYGSPFSNGRTRDADAAHSPHSAKT